MVRCLFPLFILLEVAGALVALAGEAELNAARQELQAAREEAGLAEQPELAKPITTAERLFSVPERENRMAQAIAALTIAARSSPRAPVAKQQSATPTNNAAPAEE